MITREETWEWLWTKASVKCVATGHADQTFDSLNSNDAHRMHTGSKRALIISKVPDHGDDSMRLAVKKDEEKRMGIENRWSKTKVLISPESTRTGDLNADRQNCWLTSSDSSTAEYKVRTELSSKWAMLDRCRGVCRVRVCNGLCGSNESIFGNKGSTNQNKDSPDDQSTSALTRSDCKQKHFGILFFC